MSKLPKSKRSAQIVGNLSMPNRVMSSQSKFARSKMQVTKTMSKRSGVMSN